MRNTDYFIDKLRNSGLRPTKQRITICEILFSNKETFHFSINDLAKFPPTKPFMPVIRTFLFFQ